MISGGPVAALNGGQRHLANCKINNKNASMFGKDA
jgi:hypothetical protein